MGIILVYEIEIDNVLDIEEAVCRAMVTMRDPTVTATFNFQWEEPVKGIGGGIVDFTPEGKVNVIGTYPSGG